MSDITRSISSVSSIKLPCQIKISEPRHSDYSASRLRSSWKFHRQWVCQSTSLKTNPLYFLLGSGGARTAVPWARERSSVSLKLLDCKSEPCTLKKSSFMLYSHLPIRWFSPSLASNTRSANILERGTDYGMGDQPVKNVVYLKSPESSTQSLLPPWTTLNLPREYADLIEVFSKRKASQLPAHRSVDCAIDLLPGTTQIKSNHFYCHITTAQVPWWVKFLSEILLHPREGFSLCHNRNQSPWRPTYRRN